MVLSNYLIIIICLHIAIRFQVFLSNTNNFQTDLCDPQTERTQISVMTPARVYQ